MSNRKSYRNADKKWKKKKRCEDCGDVWSYRSEIKCTLCGGKLEVVKED